MPFFVPGLELIRVLSSVMTMRSLWDMAIPTFIKCLQSLPNLHTLEIGFMDYRPRPSLFKNMLKNVKLPQVKTLVLPTVAHPLIKRCPNVEDVDWVIADQNTISDEFLGSLTSNRDSKIKRLAIPLVLRGNPSSKRSSNMQDHKARKVTDCLRTQNLWLRVQGSLNSPSSTLTHIYTHTKTSHLAQKP